MSQSDKLTRREILEAGTLAVTASCFSSFKSLSSILSTTDRHLVLVHLKGGNDALNTVVPYKNIDYYKMRGELALKKGSVLKLDQTHGFHPSLAELLPIYKNGDLALVLGAGYKNSSMSHFLSTAVWQSGDLDGNQDTKWFEEKIANDMSVLEIEMDGFDTHSMQLEPHAKLLKALGSKLSKLYLENSFCNSMIFVYSEFGRSITPNEDGGTDHGEAGLIMLIGKNIEGGIYGDYGSLDGPSDSLSASIDFRDVHNSILTNWISPKSLSHQNKQFSPLTVGISHCV